MVSEVWMHGRDKLTEALATGVWEALRKHKQADNPVVSGATVKWSGLSRKRFRFNTIFFR